MMESELRQLLSEHGWKLYIRKRRERLYAYAQRWRTNEAYREVYLKPLDKLSTLTPEEVLRKIS